MTHDVINLIFRTYTIKKHIENLENMLKLENIYRKCPASKNYSPDMSPTIGACTICKRFVGLTRFKKCPCIELGTKTAIERTKVRLHNLNKTNK